MRYYFISLVCLSFFCQGQVVTDDFEGNGNITTWYGDDCGINTSFSNVYVQGINNSNTVLEYKDTGGQYANIGFDSNENFDLETYNAFTLKIYVASNGTTGSQPNQISLKLQNGTLGAPWSTQSEIIKPLVLDQWQALSFDFGHDNYINIDGNSLPPINRTDFNRVVIQINGENNTDQVLAYVDGFYNHKIEVESPIESVFDNLVWSDEFDGNGAINSANWFHQTQLPVGGSWYNGEVQHYTDQEGNSYVSDGVLKIVAKKEAYNDQGYTKAYTSARLNSKFTFTYGRVEVRAKLPMGVGTWPAIWMLGKNINEDGAYWDNAGFGTTNWPFCGEIDIMEHWGSNQNYVQSAMHTPSSYGGTINHGGQTIATASSQFHVYTLDWFEDKMVFGVDGVSHYTYNPTTKNAETWPFDVEQYILLNIAIQPSIASSFIQSEMEIDYVRIYQESNLSVSNGNTFENAQLFPNPVRDKLTIQVPSSFIGAKATIYTTQGKILNTFIQKESRTIINLSHYEKGMYIVRFETKTGSFGYKVLKI